MMKTAKDFLEAEVARHVGAAREITRGAEDANRSLSDEERGQVEEAVAQATLLKSRIKEIEDNQALQDRLADISLPGTAEPSDAPTKARSVGERFVQSEAYQGLKARGLSGRWTTGPVEMTGVKTVGDDTVDLASAGQEVLGAPQVVGGIVPLITGIEPYRMVVSELFGQGVASTNQVAFLIESIVDDDAYIVAEKAEKPSSYLEFTATTVNVEKLATWLAISDEMLEDGPATASYINDRLGLFVRRAEQERLLQLLDNAVSASAAAADIGGTNGFDAIYAGMTDVREDGGLEPDAVLLHPQDDAALTVLKSVGGDGSYFSGGPYRPEVVGPWGLRKVITAAGPVDNGTALVGAFREGAAVWRRGGMTLEASNSHDDFFIKNKTAIRAEERLALTVYRPAAFSFVTIP